MCIQVSRGNSGKSKSPFFHTKKVVLRASVECRIRNDRANKKGMAPVYLQIIINGQIVTKPLQVSWPVDCFDRKKGIFLARRKKDQEATDWNIFVTKEKAKVNDIFMYYRHGDIQLTKEKFNNDYERFELKKDFIAWALDRVNSRFDDLKIADSTFRSRKYQLGVIRSFSEKIPFHDLNLEFLERFEVFCLRKEYSLNTISTFMRMLQSMVRSAARSGIAVDLKSVNEYSPASYTPRLIFLEPDEIKRLEEYYQNARCPEHHRLALEHFLFSCYTGLRFSDVRRISWRNINNNLLVFVPFKGNRTNTNRLTIPLTKKAMSYVKVSSGQLFGKQSEQKTNKHLKNIAVLCEIRKHLTMHVGRHTFATEFLRRGGRLETLQKLLGHIDIKTTMIYAHVSTETLVDQMALFDS